MGNKHVKTSSDNAESAEQRPIEREQWASPVEFVLSNLGSVVGLGNVWRFPYLCYVNGGAAFLIPYVLILFIISIPLVLLEFTVGQYSGLGPIQAFDAVPLFRGVGVGMVIMMSLSAVYYNIVIAWSFYYLFASWNTQLPWSSCGHEFNTPQCYSHKEATTLCTGDDKMAIWYNKTCYNSTYLAQFDNFYTCNTTVYNSTGLENHTVLTDIVNGTGMCVSNMMRDTLGDLVKVRSSASQEYYLFGVLDMLPSMDVTGTMKWQLVLLHLLGWILCYLSLIRGIQSMGKVVYFTAIFPYVMIIILLIRGAMLEGALEGIKFYLIPKWHQLAVAKVWVDAAGLNFFSLGIGGGRAICFASYNKFNHNIYRDTFIISVGNALSSFVAGFVVFSILGHLAAILNTEVDKVATAGSGLVFVTYPEVVQWLEPPQLWATFFFLMLLTLGLDSEFGGVEIIVTVIVDHFPRSRRYRPLVALAVCFFFFLTGLLLCTQTGVYWLDLISYYAHGWALILVGLAEVIVFAWIYTAKRLMKDIEAMGMKIWWHWWLTWTLITPLVIGAILIFNLYEFTPLSFGQYLLPHWAQTVGWLCAFVSLVPIPVWMVIEMVQSYKSHSHKGLNFGKRLCVLCRPNDNWIPSPERRKNTQRIELVNNTPPPYSGIDHPNQETTTDCSTNTVVYDEYIGTRF